MYAIMSGGALLALCDKPRYVRRNPESGAYIQTAEEDAEAIAVNGVLYNLPGGTAIPDAPEADAVERDVSEYVFRNRVRIEENGRAAGTAFLGVENAVCELDAGYDGRIGAVEDALCELDGRMNEGGSI